MKRQTAALCLTAALCVSALLARSGPGEGAVPAAATVAQTAQAEEPSSSFAGSVPEPPAEAPAAPDVPWEEIQAEFLPLPAGPGGAYTVGSAPVNWRFSVRTDVITDEEHYRPSDWLDSARAAVMDSALYRAALAESDRHTKKELKETYADYGDYYGWDDVLRPKFVSGIISDFDRNGETESFLVFRLPLAGVWGGYIDCVAFVGWGGEAALVTLSANTELSEINYGEHMTLVGVRSYTGRIADHSYREYRVRDGKPVCVLDQFRAGESVGDVFRRFGMAQCPYEWLLFWDADREAYAQVALEPVDSGTISALYRSGAEQPFDESYLELNWMVAGGVYYQAAPGGQPRGYRYENGQFVEDAPLGENGYLLNAHGGDPIPTALGVNIAAVMEQAYPRRISETRYASLADGSSVALRFSGYGDMSYFAGEAENAEFDTLEIIDGGKVTQTFPLEPYRPQSVLVDYNFDGNQDLLSYSGNGNLGSFFDCFLWNPQSRLYEIYEPFSSLPNLEADPARKRIYTYMPYRPYGSMEATLRWKDGVLVFDEVQSWFTLYPIPMSCTTVVRQQGEEAVRERRYTLDEESAELILNRPAARFETPEVAGVEDMLRILPFASDRDAWIGGAEWGMPDLLELVYAHNREFLSIGSGVGGADLKRLRGLHRNAVSPFGLSIATVYSGQFARFDDMERAGKYLFGDEFRLEGGECGDCGDRIFYTEPLKVADGRGSETRSVLPLAVKQEADSCEITFAEILVAGDFIVHPNWVADGNWEIPGIIVGYVGDDGGCYFYDDVDLDRFPRYTATFRQAGNGHYYIADCERIEPDGET